MNGASDKPEILRVHKLNKSFGTNHVLKDATLTLRKGELKVLIGPSGGGKSTLLQCMNFLITPDSGRVWLEGEEIFAHKKRELYTYRSRWA